MNKLVLDTDDIPEIVIETTSAILNNFNPMTGDLPVYTDDELNKLYMPIIFLGGERDVIMDTIAAGNRLGELCNNADINIIKNNGHVIYNQAEIICSFLERST